MCHHNNIVTEEFLQKIGFDRYAPDTCEYETWILDGIRASFGGRDSATTINCNFMEIGDFVREFLLRYRDVVTMKRALS